MSSSASGAVARCGSSKLRCPCAAAAGDERLHPPGRSEALPPGLIVEDGLGEKKKRERERQTERVGADGVSPDVRYAPRSRSPT